MNIKIYDDNKDDVERLKLLCNEYKKKNNIDIVMECDDSWSIVETRNFDLIFLDIEMPGENGIEIQKKLELNFIKPFIVFVTNYPSYSLNSHGMNVIGFLVKPVTYNQIKTVIDKARILLSNNRIIYFGKQAYNIKEIVYIYMDSGCSKAYLNNDKISIGTFKTMKQWEDDLTGNWFVKANRSTIVNCKYINSIKEGNIILKNNEKIHISRREIKSCKSFFEKYLEYYSMLI